MLDGVALLLIVAVSIYLAFPTWKRWRKQLVPLPPEDIPEVMTELTTLCREAELKRQPQFLWNPLNPVSEGLAFGHMGRYAVALTGGLVKQAYDDPPAFRAILRHELAHLRNGDVDKTYLSVAIWWAFVITALVPFVAYILLHSINGFVFADLPFLLDVSLQVLALTALVLLMRNAVLRARELYADARASTWDGPEGALERMLEHLPQTKRGRYGQIMQITQTHPEPRMRRATLHDSWPLLQIGFWDALGAGVAASIAFAALERFFFVLTGGGSQQIVPAALVFGSLAAGVVGTGLWRATCASFKQGKTARGVGWIAVGMMCGILIGQSLSLSSINHLPALNTLGSFLTLWTAWSLLLLLSLWLILRWIVATATIWLRVATTTSMLLWSSRLGLVIAGGFWAVCFGILMFLGEVLSFLIAFAGLFDSVSFLIEFSLVAAILLMPLFFVIGLLCLGGFPLAAQFWHRRAAATAQQSPLWRESMPGQGVRLEREPVQFRRALLVAIVGALLFCGILVALRLWIRLIVPEAVWVLYGREIKLGVVNWAFSRAAVIQGGIAIVTAAWVRRSGVLLGLFAAFIAGCVMTIGFLGLNLLLGGSIDLDFTWIILSGIVIPGGLLAVLFAPLSALLAKWIGPALRAALVGVFIYCVLILCMTIGWRFITRQPATSDQLVSIGTTLLVWFQVLVGAIVAGRSLRRGWLYGLFAAFITGWLGHTSRLLAANSTISSFAQGSEIILEGAFIAIMGMLSALPVVLVVFFVTRWIRRSRLRKAVRNPATTTTPTSSTQ